MGCFPSIFQRTAATAIIQLPQETITTILRLLSRDDIKSFRQASHWTERRSFDIFAELGYRSVKIDLRAKSTARILSVLINSSCLANAVQKVQITFGMAIHLDCARSHHLDPSQVKNALQKLGYTTVGELFSSLPKLNELELWAVDIDALSQGFPARASQAVDGAPASKCTALDHSWLLDPAHTTITTLHLKYISISSDHFNSLLKACGPSLRELYIDGVRISDKNWHGSISEITSTSPKLSRLSLNSSRQRMLGRFRREDGSEYEREITGKLDLARPFSRFSKAWRSTSGLEIVTIQTSVAEMKGRGAVEMGLAEVLAYLEAD